MNDDKAEVEPEWKTVPNRRDLRGAGLTIATKRRGHFRRQAIKRMRLEYEVLAR